MTKKTRTSRPFQGKRAPRTPLRLELTLTKGPQPLAEASITLHAHEDMLEEFGKLCLQLTASEFARRATKSTPSASPPPMPTPEDFKESAEACGVPMSDEEARKAAEAYGASPL
jgi:hypothetical protein